MDNPMMERSLRRRIAKAKVPADLVEEIVGAGRIQAIRIYNAAMLLALRDEFDFGRVRLNRVMEAITDKFDSILQNYAEIDDYEQIILEETGIKID